MQITTSQTQFIFPSQPPPFEDKQVLSLSHIDTDPNLLIPIRYIRAYANTNPPTNDDPFAVITNSLSQALVHYYPFTGILKHSPEDNRLELVCARGRGVPVVSATANGNLASISYLDDLVDHVVEQLVPNLSLEESLVNPLVLQVTVFECGGFCLGACVNNTVCDGLGATQFFNAMAEFAHGAARPSVEPVWNRERLLGPREPPKVGFPLHEFLHLDEEFKAYSEPAGLVVRECFHVKEDQLDRFKKRLVEESGLNFTSFEALGAFLWRARVKAAEVPGDEVVKFAYSVNIRKLVKPSLPVGYWGNGCVPMYVKLPAKDLVQQPIWKTAELIKKSKENATDEYVHSFIDFQAINYGKGITAGKGVSGFTDWRHLGHSSVDFGWGDPVNILPLSRHLLGSAEPCFFLPYSLANEEKKNGFKVLVYLPEI
ncbi:hypothetical protein RJ641_002276, partial [Dillenia turbinata]